MNAPPVLAPGGNSPVVMYFRHSIIVYNKSYVHQRRGYRLSRTVVSNDESKGRKEPKVRRDTE
jgi:hypothetical protein